MSNFRGALHCGVPFLLHVYLFSKHINEYRKRKVNIELLTVLEHHCEGNKGRTSFLLQL